MLLAKKGEKIMLNWQLFNYKSLDEIRKDIEELGVDLPLSENFSVFTKPIEVNGVQLKNRLSIQPLEGFDADRDGTPSDLTFRRYRRFSAGGCGLLWFEACSVSHWAQTSRWQMHITEKNMPVFKRLVKEIRDSASNGIPPYLIVQLVNTGRNSRLDGDGTYPLIESIPQYVPAGNPYIVKKNETIITDDQLKLVQDEFVKGAMLFKEAGFDCVDIKSCHGYLISDILSSFTRKNSIYGGESFENRTRFLLETVDRVKTEVGISQAIRINACDLIPYPYGWGMKKDGSMTPDLEEPLKLFKLLLERGVRLLNVSAGKNHATHIQMPYNRGMTYPQEHQLKAMALYQSFAKKAKKAIPDAVVMTGTFAWPKHFQPYFAAGGIEAGNYDLPGFGRLPWAYPDFANDILKYGGLVEKKTCIACNRCVDMIGAAASTGCPVGCPIHDKEIYKPLYDKHCKPEHGAMSKHANKLFNMLDNPPGK